MVSKVKATSLAVIAVPSLNLTLLLTVMVSCVPALLNPYAVASHGWICAGLRALNSNRGSYMSDVTSIACAVEAASNGLKVSVKVSPGVASSARTCPCSDGVVHVLRLDEPQAAAPSTVSATTATIAPPVIDA